MEPLSAETSVVLEKEWTDENGLLYSHMLPCYLYSLTDNSRLRLAQYHSQAMHAQNSRTAILESFPR